MFHLAIFCNFAGEKKTATFSNNEIYSATGDNTRNIVCGRGTQQGYTLAGARKHLWHGHTVHRAVHGVIKLQAVRETGKFLISLLPLMFIPPTVGLIDNWGTMQEFLLPIVVISVVSTVVVIAVAGHVTQFIIKKKGGKG